MAYEPDNDNWSKLSDEEKEAAIQPEIELLKEKMIHANKVSITTKDKWSKPFPKGRKTKEVITIELWHK